ncbi:Adiponectin receptor [Fasciola gigantica]|uniref:Adiponectin receptor n=1 Tax=Fasciola gigantica TaxID=46835 RepID=A0A504YYE7_FASGI|nr:Adiponectin receptor [Fasciola gigantica]
MTGISTNAEPDELIVEIRDGCSSITSRARNSSTSSKCSRESHPETNAVPPMNNEDGESKIHCVDYLRVKDLTELMHTMAQSAEEYARHIWMRGWQVVHFQRLPAWLKDNELLIRGHRPQLYTAWECFKSVFRVHTETGNIWTHLLGCGCFIVIAAFVLAQPNDLLQWQDKAIFAGFFIGAILCLGFSCLFHTVLCHSEYVSRILSKLDYCGIAFLTMGSFVPYLYYAFYCVLWAKLFYLALIGALGCGAIIVSMSSEFAKAQYRPLRAALFIALGLSGVIPCVHAVIINGFWVSVHHGSLGWLVLMAVLYISGASIYAARVPERCCPGKFDIWFQSHQIFHVFVVAAALVHYHGMGVLTNYRLTVGDCQPPIGHPFPAHEFANLDLLRPFIK